MKRAKWLMALGLAGSLFLPQGRVLGEDTENTRDSLRRLQGVYVVVERLDPAVKQAGLSAPGLREEIHATLHDQAIRTLTRGRWLAMEGQPHLYVNAHVVPLKESREYLYSVRVSFRQNVLPVREAVEIIAADTWSLGLVTGITGDPDRIRAAVLRQVARFIEAFRYANPH